MIVTTTDKIPDKEISEILGIARGSTVRARNIGRDIFAGLKNIIGGELSEYTKLQAESREQALQRMIEDAERLNQYDYFQVHLIFLSVLLRVHIDYCLIEEYLKNSLTNYLLHKTYPKV